MYLLKIVLVKEKKKNYRQIFKLKRGFEVNGYVNQYLIQSFYLNVFFCLDEDRENLGFVVFCDVLGLVIYDCSFSFDMNIQDVIFVYY